MTRRNRQSARTKMLLPFEALALLAPSFTTLHASIVAGGFELQASSAVHHRPKGGFSARLVYRHRSNADTVQSFVINVRNIVLDRDALSEQKTMRKR